MIYLIVMTVAVLFALLAWHNQRLVLAQSCNPAWPRLRFKLFYCFSFCTLTLMAALRYNTWTDYESYAYIFQYIDSGWTIHGEVGYRLLNKLIAYFTSNSQWIFAVTSFFTIGFIFASIKKSSANIAFSVFLFFSMGFYLQMGAIRQFLALAICMYGHTFLKSKRYLHFVLLVLLAMTIHTTAIAMLLLLLLDKKYPVGLYVSVFALSVCSMLLSDSFLSMVVSVLLRYAYLMDYSRNISELLLLFDGLILLLSLFYLKPMLARDKHNIFYVNIAFITFLLRGFFTWMPLLDRVVLYFEIYLILLVPNLLASIKNKNEKYFYSFLISGYAVAYLTYSYIILNNCHVMPYLSIFSQ